ncbi:hypothetical protein C2S51_031718 [Perilla frutescens var. frutescens]|nr:hypothetical protein C2S51_031718 [Perilla frutescens var. frutescens]
MHLSVGLVLLLCIAKGSISTTIDYHVGVILDMDSLVGRIGNSCLWMAHSDFYAEHGDYKTRLVLHPIDLSNNVVDAAAVALDLLKDVKVDAIIGPQEYALDLVMEMGDMAHVPVISFSATSPLINRTPYFVRTAQSDANQVEAIAFVVKACKWNQVVIIHEGTEFGSGITPYLFNALQDVGARVPYMSVLPKSASNDSISKELNKMRTMTTRVFVVHVSQSLGRNLFQEVNRLGMMSEGYVWIVTSEVMDLSNFANSDDDVEAMFGVVGVRPLIPNSERLKSFDARWIRPVNQGVERAGISVFGIWACDTLWALAMAAERVGNNASSFAVGVSETGPKLHKALLETRFTGLAGEFNLINGELGQTAYQIFNILGSYKRHVGTWTPSKEENTSSELNSKGIMWPGDAKTPPKGWEFPADGSELSIAVPLKPGFDELLKVEINSTTNETIVTGHYRNVFDAVMNKLPYNILYKFKAYRLLDSNGSVVRTYDDLMHQLSLQTEYGGALGDFTVTTNRSRYVDFTVPYAEGGVACIVPMKQEMAVWVLSQRIIQRSPEFQGQHVGLIHSFPFFPGQGIEANLLCVIVVIWGVVASLLWATYTASLSSMLTAARLVPTVTTVDQLMKQEGNIGYQEASFLHSYLINLKFNESRIKSLSFDEVDKELSQGNKSILGYCDAMPYIRHILSRGCNYTMIYPVYQTVGFTLAFPKGFPAFDDISRAILEMLDDGSIVVTNDTKRNDMWENCVDSDASRVSLRSFSVLFAVSGCVTLACCVGSVLYGMYTSRRSSMLDRKEQAQPLPDVREVSLARMDL